MKPLFFSFVLNFVVLNFVLLGVSFAQTSYVNIFSSVAYDSATNQVTGYAYTEPAYVNALYYTTYRIIGRTASTGQAIGMSTTTITSAVIAKMVWAGHTNSVLLT